ncbi:MAG: glycosyltransferase [Pyrinomonadaceae bacterium]
MLETSENKNFQKQGIPLVSIGMPVYNGAKFIREALDSLLSQDYSDFELIISDNASTDETAKICEKYAAKDSRIFYSRMEENIGAVRNFDRVLRLAKGKYFMWAAHDDIWHKSFISLCLTKLQSDPQAVICYCHSQTITSEGQPAEEPLTNVECIADSISERWARLHRHWKIHAVIYGLMQREIAIQTRPILAMNCSDLVFVSEMVIYGKILIVEKVMHWKRLPDKDKNHHNSPEKMIEYLSPLKEKKKIRMVRLQATLQCVRRLKNTNLQNNLRRRLTFSALFNYATSHVKYDVLDETKKLFKTRNKI